MISGSEALATLDGLQRRDYCCPHLRTEGCGACAIVGSVLVGRPFDTAAREKHTGALLRMLLSVSPTRISILSRLERVEA